jgi:class 3 adenylate cyclase/tetratricopeptide (TPR) repeat protein
VRCARCGEENPERARFCLACGASLEAEPSKQERKLVSVLFVDLVGFTGRADRSDPEDVRDMLQTYHAAAQRAIESFGGTLEKFIGDAVMAVFGAPISHGDDAERAVRAGLRVLESVAELKLEARAAVNTGEAVVSVGSGAASGQALAMGDVVNTASRLQSSAPPGGLVVSEETYRLTRNAIRYESSPALDAKGKGKPVTVWRAIAPAEAAPDRLVIPMVGRDRELDLLDSIWSSAVRDRRPHLVTIIGPPGIGKSRLQREFSNRVHLNGGAVARGRCLPYGDRAAYSAFAQLVRATAGIYENDSRDTAQAKLAATIQSLFPKNETEEATRFLSLLIGLGVAEPVLQRDFLFFTARRFLECLASVRALLVVFEDVHWADNGLLDLVEYLATHVRDTPIVLACLARPEFIDHRPGWGSGLFAHTTIGLESLTTEDVAKLAAHLLVKGAARKETIERLVEAAEGNPLFVEELTSALAEGHEPGVELPTTVRAAIAARLDALPSAAREVLLDASVIGRFFWRGVLQAVGKHSDLDAALTALEARDFIRRLPTSQVQGDIEYHFKHVLIHDVAYATLPRSTRRERHAAVAKYIESVAGDANGLNAILAHHWREAGEPSKAIHYLMRAAEQALDGWSLNDAVSLYTSAIELAVDDEQRAQIWLARGLARSRLGDYPAAVKDLGELMPQLTGRPRIEGLLGWTWATHWTSRTDETIAGAEEALHLAEALGDRELIPVATARMSQGLAMRGGPGDIDGANELGEAALRMWAVGSRPWDRLNHNHMLGEQYYWTGRIAEADALMVTAMQSTAGPDSIEARLRSAALRAQILCSKGRYEESMALFDQTMELAVELGRPLRILRNYSTQPLREIFELEEARRRSEECLVGSEELAGFTMPRANAMADLVQTAVLAGDFATAETAWKTQWDDTLKTTAWDRWLVGGRLAASRAEMALVMDRLDEALEWARKAIELSVPVRRLKYEIVGRIVLGQVLLASGKAKDAVASLKVTIEKADRLDSPPLRWRARAAAGKSLYATGDDNGAAQAFAEASTIVNDVAAALTPQRSARFLAVESIREVLNASTKARS